MREKSFGFIFWLAFFISYCFFWNKAEENGKNRQTFVIRYRDDDQTIPVTVVLDYKKQTEYVINMNPRTPAKSVTLYDFKQRTIAYKDLTNKECFLGKLTYETLSEESNALQDVKNPVEVKPKIRSLDPKTPALTPTEIRNIAGQKTAAFCRKMNTWLLMPEKSHSISKREADEEFEEHTLQYHGHRSSQYSHYERQTRRRYRNRGQANHLRRSHNKEGVAGKENGRFAVSELNTNLHHFNSQPSSIPHLHHEHFKDAAGTNKQNHPSYLETPQSNFPSTYRNVENENENLNNKIPSDKVFSNTPVILEDSFKYPDYERRHTSPDNASIYPRQHYLNLTKTDDQPSYNHAIMSDSTKNISEPSERNFRLSSLWLDDSNSETGEKIVTTEIPEFFNQLRTDHPNVHSSLLHLLPLYKPLGREFEFAQETKKETPSNNDALINKQSNLEKEDHDPSTHFISPNNTPLHFPDVNNTFNNPDVSINVLEVPKITKEFENVEKKHGHAATAITTKDNSKRLSNSLKYRPSLVQTHPSNRNDISRQLINKDQSIHLNHSKNDRKEIPLNRNLNYFSESETISTTEHPLLTTRKNFTPEKTTAGILYAPSVHTAFRNLEDFNSFNIFPNYIDDNLSPISTETSLNALHVDKTINSNGVGIPQELIISTIKPFIDETKNTKSNQRSDIPSKNVNDDFDESKAQHISYPFDNYNKTGEDIFPHKIRYQNALRGFKPDEIVIDIENIPTHTPTPVTASFQERIFTTAQPIFRVLPKGEKSVKIEAARRGEQISVTPWRSFIPTTKFPRRRTNHKSRIPIQSSSVPFEHRSSTNHNRNKLPSSHLNQLTGLGQFNPSYPTNRQQIYYPSHSVSSPNLHMTPEINQLHHVNHLNNLPPGVSVHPRHPQAPFADMVHSNRPPTMPILSDNQEHLKPHRQRHHRKKDRPHHSCCRLRGNSGALQSCCRNGGPCCSTSHRFVPPSNCCSSSKVNRQIIPANQIQPHVRTANKILPSIRTEKTHRSEVDNKDRCQKEKMCRTLYESTQQVMVCRNANVEGC